MAYEEVLTSITLPASADLSSYQYHLVSATTAATAQLQTTKGGYVVGVLQDKSTAANIGSKIGIFGVTKVAAGNAATTGFNVGTPLVAATSSVATVWSTAGSYVVGYALEHLTSGTSGVVSMLINHAGYRTS